MTKNRHELMLILCSGYEHGEEWQPSQRLIEAYRGWVNTMFKRIPVPIRWACDVVPTTDQPATCNQPFHTSGQMYAYFKTKGELLMLSEDSIVLGRELYSAHRACHDWYGHIVPGHPFGGHGEAASFVEHTTHTPREFWPIIFSDVVLTNAYWEVTGKPFGREHWVNDERLIQLVLKDFLRGG